eukprot:m.377647 g.377647  ORF g.377647 m.377647 type:complete len:436 (+) comp16705_c4_seq43:312-1619(+)
MRPATASTCHSRSNFDGDLANLQTFGVHFQTSDSSMPWEWAPILETVNELAKSPMGQLVLGGGAMSVGVVVSTGLVPRVGLGRALGLALRSKLFPVRLHTVSRRTDDVYWLQESLESLKRGMYIVVTGPMGVGKSTAVETALWRTCGVVSIDVPAEMSDTEVISAALAEIARTRQHKYLDPYDNARRVRFFYDFLPVKPPTILLNVHERRSGKDFAGVVYATRKLANLDYRVVVDGSTNALPGRLLHTNRQKVMTVGPMTMDVMETVPEFRYVFDLLRELERFDLVWATCGGNPALMVNLETEPAMRRACLTTEGRFKPESLTPESARELKNVVDAFCLERVRQAVGLVSELTAKHPELTELVEMFKTVDIVAAKVMTARAIVLPNDDKVFRTADTSGALIPATAATALVLRHGLADTPTIEELHSLVGGNAVAP